MIPFSEQSHKRQISGSTQDNLFAGQKWTFGPRFIVYMCVCVELKNKSTSLYTEPTNMIIIEQCITEHIHVNKLQTVSRIKPRNITN